jgi:phage baseplate assembly protein W
MRVPRTGSVREKARNVAFPYGFDGRGRTATDSDNDHIRDMIEQVLFTAPGERVNRPDFGCGLLQLVFAPNSSELATSTQVLVQGAQPQALGDIIDLTNVVVSAEDSTLTVTVQYTVRSTQQQAVVQFTHGASAS